MFKLTVKSLFARKLRLALTSIAIVLGVSFIVSSFVIADSLRSTFHKLVNDIEDKTDLTVRTTQEFGTSNDRPPIAASVLPIVQRTEGVKAAEGHISQLGLTLVKADGERVKKHMAPIIGVNTSSTPELNQFLQMSGRPPQGPNEFALDIDVARDEGFELGQPYTVSSPAKGNRQFTLAGTFAFHSTSNDTIGAALVAFDTPTAQDFLGFEGKFSEIAVAADPNARAADVQARLSSKLPPGTEAVDRAVKVAEQQDDFDKVANIFGTVLLAFAIVTVVVSAFIINNTFQIVLGQRIRELALLRALGATGSQVSRSVFLEALVVGAFSTAVGIGTGVGLSVGLRGLFGALGFSLPSGHVVVQPRTIFVAILVGVGVTLLSAIAPGRKARKVPPIAALRDDYQLARTGLRRRLIMGGVASGIGVLFLGYGLFGGLGTAPLLVSISTGALAVFIGVNLLSPIVARPVARGLGAPIEGAYKTIGRLSRENAARNPRRTASTAAALMIGLALVSMSAVVQQSIKKTFLDTLDKSVQADFFIRSQQTFDPNSGVPPTFTEALAAQPEFDSVVPYRFAPQGVKVENKVKDIMATRLAMLSRHINPDVKSGSIDGAGTSGLLIHKDSAKDLKLNVGDKVDVTFIDNQHETLTVAAIYSDATILGNWVIDLDVWSKHFSRQQDQFVTAKIKDGVSLQQATAAVNKTKAPYPQIKAENRDEFKKTQKKLLDSILVVIAVLLLFAGFIALIGIANTLALSVFERTRELGLLRAVGMTRRQLRRMVRWEAVIIAVFGGILGVVLGVIFGVAAASAVPEAVVKSVSIPIPVIVFCLVVAGIFGVIAAYFPARRAGNLNVLEAISFE